MDKLKIEEIYKKIAKEGSALQSFISEAQKKNGIIESLFIELQNEIKKQEVDKS